MSLDCGVPNILVWRSHEMRIKAIPRSINPSGSRVKCKHGHGCVSRSSDRGGTCAPPVGPRVVGAAGEHEGMRPYVEGGVRALLSRVHRRTAVVARACGRGRGMVLAREVAARQRGRRLQDRVARERRKDGRVLANLCKTRRRARRVLRL